MAGRTKPAWVVQADKERREKKAAIKRDERDRKRDEERATNKAREARIARRGELYQAPRVDLDAAGRPKGDDVRGRLRLDRPKLAYLDREWWASLNVEELMAPALGGGTVVRVPYLDADDDGKSVFGYRDAWCPIDYPQAVALALAGLGIPVQPNRKGEAWGVTYPKTNKRDFESPRVMNWGLDKPPTLADFMRVEHGLVPGKRPTETPTPFVGLAPEPAPALADRDEDARADARIAEAAERQAVADAKLADDPWTSVRVRRSTLTRIQALAALRGWKLERTLIELLNAQGVLVDESGALTPEE